MEKRKDAEVDQCGCLMATGKYPIVFGIEIC